MAQAPLRRGVGREALMKHAHRRFKLRVGEVGVEARQIFRHHQALVDQHTARQMRDVELVVALRGEQFLGAATRLEQLQLERSEEHTSELQSLMRISYAVFCLKKKIPHK